MVDTEKGNMEALYKIAFIRQAHPASYGCWFIFFLCVLIAENLIHVLVIGLGGGSLPLFIHDYFLQSCIDVVEIDPDVLDVAIRWFGFSPGDRLKVHIADGLTYISSLAAKGKTP